MKMNKQTKQRQANKQTKGELRKKKNILAPERLSVLLEVHSNDGSSEKKENI